MTDVVFADLAEEVCSAARQVLRGFRGTPGGDAYEYRGSMNDVESLREAVEGFEGHLIMRPDHAAR